MSERPAITGNNTSPPPIDKKSRGMLYLKVVGGIFVTLTTAGYLCGRAVSPQYNDPTNSPLFIRRVVRNLSEKSAPSNWVIERYDDGRIKSFRPQIPSLSFTCGIDVRTYDTGKRLITKAPAPGNQSSEVPRLGISYPEMMGFLVAGGTGSYTALYTAGKTGESSEALLSSASVGEKVSGIAGALLLSAVGFGVGYFIGFDDSVKCGEPLFRQLLDDPAFWQGVTSDFVADHYWMIEYSDQLLRSTQFGNVFAMEEFTECPEWARPPARASFDEIQLLHTPFARVRLQSWHPATFHEFDTESIESGVYHEKLFPKDSEISPISTQTTFKCQSYRCLPEELMKR